MRLRSMACVMAAGVVAAAVFLAGCGPTDTTKSGQPTNAPGSTSTPTAQTVKDITPGNCTLYTKDQAIALLGAVNDNNKNLEINTADGTKIDTCSYEDLKPPTVEGVSYAVVRFDSDATAFARAQQVQTEMLGDAAEHDWPVQTLATTPPGAGQLLGGYGTKTEQGVTFTIAVVGTNVGPYLVAALGGSTLSADRAKSFALTLFQSLAATAS